MDRHVLITGGTGKTGSRLAALLREKGVTPRIASRAPRPAGSTDGAEAVRFDWQDPGSFGGALAGVAAVYLVAPANDWQPLAAMQPFIEQALGAGVGRFVLLSASSLPEGGPMMGAVHALLKQRAPRWTALRPTWFMQNFSEQQHRPTIQKEGAIYSATDDGRVPFIDAGDIAAVAAEALLRPDFASGDLVLTGPAPLSYDEVARLLSAACGRRIEHRRLSEEQLAARFQATGLPPAYAAALAALDRSIAAGAEDRVTDTVERVTGRAPTDFATFAAAVREVWRP